MRRLSGRCVVSRDTDLSAGLVTFQDQFREQVLAASKNNLE